MSKIVVEKVGANDFGNGSVGLHNISNELGGVGQESKIGRVNGRRGAKSLF